jgi:phospholipid N-methyltransferase
MITEEVIFLNQVSKPKYENQIQQLIPSSKLFLGYAPKLPTKLSSNNSSVVVEVVVCDMPLIQVFKSFSRSIQGNLEKSR